MNVFTGEWNKRMPNYHWSSDFAKGQTPRWWGYVTVAWLVIRTKRSSGVHSRCWCLRCLVTDWTRAIAPGIICDFCIWSVFVPGSFVRNSKYGRFMKLHILAGNTTMVITYAITKTRSCWVSAKYPSLMELHLVQILRQQICPYYQDWFKLEIWEEEVLRCWLLADIDIVELGTE